MFGARRGLGLGVIAALVATFCCGSRALRERRNNVNDCLDVRRRAAVGFAAGFEQKLVGLGYRPGGVAMQLRLMRQLDRWLADAGLDADDLIPERVEQFLAACRARGQRRVPTLASGAALSRSLATRTPRCTL